MPRPDPRPTDAPETSAAPGQPETPAKRKSFLFPGMRLPFILLVICFAAWGLAGNLTDPLVAVFGSTFSTT